MDWKTWAIIGGVGLYLVWPRRNAAPRYARPGDPTPMDGYYGPEYGQGGASPSIAEQVGGALSTGKSWLDSLLGQPKGSQSREDAINRFNNPPPASSYEPAIPPASISGGITGNRAGSLRYYGGGSNSGPLSAFLGT